MRELVNDMLLYHGSYCEVHIPDLKRCAGYKDFGRGFYLTSSKKQAENFAKISTRKAVANKTVGSDQGYGFVSVFKFELNDKLSVKTYSSADTMWLHCIVGHRRKRNFLDLVQKSSDFDIICGKIANDNTNATITAYMAGAFGEIGSKIADDICIRLLIPERLQDQFCFRTDAALNCLTFMESEKIWL